MGDGDRLRIAHLSDNYPPSKGGLERSVQSISQVQVESGHEVAVVTTHLEGQPDDSVVDGVRIHRLPFALQHLPGAFQDDSRVFFPPLPEPLFAHHLLKVLRGFRPDVVHVHGWVLYSALGPAAKVDAAVVATAHDYGSVCTLKTLFRDDAVCSGPALGKCVRCAADSYGVKGVPIALGMHLASGRHRRVDEWTAISTAVARAGSAPVARDRQEMVVIPSFVPDSVVGVDLEVPRPSFVPATGPYLFFAGALGAHKGVEVLLEAHRMLREGGFHVPLVLAGMASPGKTVDTARPDVTTALEVPHDAVMAGWVERGGGSRPVPVGRALRAGGRGVPGGRDATRRHPGGWTDRHRRRRTVRPGGRAWRRPGTGRSGGDPPEGSRTRRLPGRLRPGAGQALHGVRRAGRRGGELPTGHRHPPGEAQGRGAVTAVRSS